VLIIAIKCHPYKIHAAARLAPAGCASPAAPDARAGRRLHSATLSNNEVPAPRDELNPAAAGTENWVRRMGSRCTLPEVKRLSRHKKGVYGCALRGANMNLFHDPLDIRLFCGPSASPPTGS